MTSYSPHEYEVNHPVSQHHHPTDEKGHLVLWVWTGRPIVKLDASTSLLVLGHVPRPVTERY